MRQQQLEDPSLPCFSPAAAGESALLRLAVAPACNLRCFLCTRGSRRAAEAGGQDAALAPEAALAAAAAAVERGDDISGVLLWGPGEPLVNASTYVVLRQLQWSYPDLPVTVATNGIILPERLEELVRTGVGRLIVSVSATTAAAAQQLYASVSYRARQYAGREAAELVLQQQWNGLENAVEAGLAVTAYVPSVAGVNSHEIAAIRQRAESVGAEHVTVVELSS